MTDTLNERGRFYLRFQPKSQSFSRESGVHFARGYYRPSELLTELLGAFSSFTDTFVEYLSNALRVDSGGFCGILPNHSLRIPLDIPEKDGVRQKKSLETLSRFG